MGCHIGIPTLLWHHDKRKAPKPNLWDDGTTCPCGHDVGTGKTEKWTQCDAFDC